MDGQDYEELEANASMKHIEGIYIGTNDHKDEISLSYFFKKNEFDDIIRKLNKMWKYYLTA